MSLFFTRRYSTRLGDTLTVLTANSFNHLSSMPRIIIKAEEPCSTRKTSATWAIRAYIPRPARLNKLLDFPLFHLKVARAYRIDHWPEVRNTFALRCICSAAQNDFVRLIFMTANT